MLTLLGFHIVGAAGGLAARRLRVPAGALIGAMVAVLLLNSITGWNVYYPPVLRALVQACSGAAIGCRFLKEDLQELRQIGKAACLLMLMLFSFHLLFSFLIAQVGHMGMLTALFACAPGGVSDLALIAADFGADTESVMVLQMIRFVFVVSFFPPFMKRKYLRMSGAPLQKETSAAPKPQKTRQPMSAKQIGKLTLLMIAACAGGLLLRQIGVPAGAILGAMLIVIACNLTIGQIPLPNGLKTTVQICCGVYIGNQVTRDVLMKLPALALPMVLVIVEVLVMAFGTAWVLSHCTKLPIATCLFASTPGGIAEMGLIAEEMKLDTPKIVALHTCRLILTICVMPILVRLVT